MAVSVQKNAGAVTQLNPSTRYSFVPWTNTSGGMTVGDGQYATAGLTAGSLGPNESYYFYSYNFGFSIPSSARVVGIQADITGHGSPANNAQWFSAWLETTPVTGTARGSTSSGGPIPGTDATATFGGPTNLWGGTWSPGDVSVIALAVATVATTGAVTVFLDGAKLTVFYYIPRPGQPPKICKQARYAGRQTATTSAFITPLSDLRRGGSKTTIRGPQFPRIVKAILATQQDFFKLNVAFSLTTAQVYQRSLGAISLATTQAYVKKFVISTRQLFFRAVNAVSLPTSQNFKRVRKRVFGGR